jgi:hypothetical protein
VGELGGGSLAAFQHRIVEAVVAGMSVERIEDTIIDPAPLDGEQKSALWLYAEVLWGRHREGMLVAPKAGLAWDRSW